jgi:hypothetical protein
MYSLEAVNVALTQLNQAWSFTNYLALHASKTVVLTRE